MNESFVDSVIEQMTETHPDTAQSESQETSSSANIWEGNPLYYQSGKKMGQLKAGAQPKKSKEFSGLDLDGLKATETEKDNTVIASGAQDAKAEKAKAKAERKSSDARIGAKIAMRVLDTLVKWISGGEYGKDFTSDQRKARNEYAEELENDWREYLLTLDIPLHPALIVAFGSTLYVGDAFTTPKGQARAQSFKDKIIAKIAVGMFSKKP